jgi:zinc D-Ala-D-Ala carboxypeptidase
MDGAAFDIAMANHDPVAFEAAAREVGFLGFGFYPRSGFMHIDLGPARQWGERFPASACLRRRRRRERGNIWPTAAR